LNRVKEYILFVMKAWFINCDDDDIVTETETSRRLAWTLITR